MNIKDVILLTIGEKGLYRGSEICHRLYEAKRDRTRNRLLRNLRSWILTKRIYGIGWIYSWLLGMEAEGLLVSEVEEGVYRYRLTEAGRERFLALQS
ncbi:MAG: hypothetical protein ACM3NH_04640 [Candidatus Saccharibacteria bacterium]